MSEIGSLFVRKLRSPHLEDYSEDVKALLDSSNLLECLQRSGKDVILIKPNLLSTSPPPVTTPVQLVDAIVGYLQERFPEHKLIVGEGTSIPDYTTFTPFRELGFSSMAKRRGIELIDLNDLKPQVTLRNSEFKRFPELILPEISLNSFILSVPVLKAHMFSDVTLTMKNMMGLVPPEHYRRGYYQKSAFHSRMHESVFDLAQHRSPDFSVLDASRGLPQHHLGGREIEPKELIAGSDPVAIDAYGAGLLGFKWRNIGFISMANGVIGNAEASEKPIIV